MDTSLGRPSRRTVLRTSGGTLLGALAGGLLGSTRTATAQPLSGAVPEVDRLAVRVVSDSYHHAFEPTRKIGDV